MRSAAMFTALLITLLVVAGAATWSGWVYTQRRRQLAGGPSDLSDAPLLGDGRGNLIERGIYELRVGDVVSYDGRDFLVEGVLEYDEDGRRWRGARMVDAGESHWLITGLGAQTSLRLMQTATDVEVSGYPPETLVAGGTRYNMDKRGTASARFAGDLGRMPGKRGQVREDTIDRCRWWRYESAGDDTMLVEQWGDEYRVLRGTNVPEGSLDMMPGS